MRAIQYVKSIPRYGAVRLCDRWWPRVATSRVGCTRLVHRDAPTLPSDQWVRVRPLLAGICGSDLATISTKNSPYFSPLLSYPFVFGHEIVGRIEEVGAAVDEFAPGDKVLVEPALCCAVRGLEPACPACRAGRYACCWNIMHGTISPGIQTGYCRDTGGGWSESLCAHVSQLLRAPDDVPTEALVLVEPYSCALHAVLTLPCAADATALVMGCGSIGLLVIAALRAIRNPCRIIAVVRYAHQAEQAKALGADCIVYDRDRLEDQIVELTGAQRLKPEIGGAVFIGGVDVTYDCVGSSHSLDRSIRFTRAGGAVGVVGMPAVPRGIDWTAIWYKELKVVGAYAYGLDEYEGERVRTFALAARFVSQQSDLLTPLVGARFALAQFRDAIDCARFTRRSGVIKTVFEITTDEQA